MCAVRTGRRDSFFRWDTGERLVLLYPPSSGIVTVACHSASILENFWPNAPSARLRALSLESMLPALVLPKCVCVCVCVFFYIIPLAANLASSP